MHSKPQQDHTQGNKTQEANIQLCFSKYKNQEGGQRVEVPSSSPLPSSTHAWKMNPIVRTWGGQTAETVREAPYCWPGERVLWSEVCGGNLRVTQGYLGAQTKNRQRECRESSTRRGLLCCTATLWHSFSLRIWLCLLR